MDFLTEVIVAVRQVLEWLGVEQHHADPVISEVTNHLGHHLTGQSAAAEWRTQRNEVHANNPREGPQKIRDRLAEIAVIRATDFLEHLTCGSMEIPEFPKCGRRFRIVDVEVKRIHQAGGLPVVFDGSFNQEQAFALCRILVEISVQTFDFPMNVHR